MTTAPALLPDQVRAILWAQWRILRNVYPRRRGGLIFTAIISVVWYGGFALFGWMAFVLCSSSALAPSLPRGLPVVLFFIFLYWQLMPVAAASAGASLDLKRLLPYPIPHGHLYFLELLLRLPISIEMLLVLTGIASGLIVNPAVTGWAGPLALLTYTVFNFFVSAGVKNSLEWLLRRKHVREFVILAIVLISALPQLLMSRGSAGGWEAAADFIGAPLLPWTAASSAAMGSAAASQSWAVLVGFTLLAYVLGRQLFERTLRQEPASESGVDKKARAEGKVKGPVTLAVLERFFAWPSILFPDPLGIVVEKELRTLARAPRFRLVFTMGFTFGLLVWGPLVFLRGDPDGLMGSNFLALVSAYALLMMGEVAFWNSFGFDRSAAQFYFVAPVRLSWILIGKNIAAASYVLMQITMVTLVCLVVGLPLRLSSIPEAYAVTVTWSLYLLALGNLTSVYWPRRMNPEQSWSSSGRGKTQLMLLVLYPVLSIPVLLAYFARYAFETDLAFYGVLGVAALVGLAFYWVALESTLGATKGSRESFLQVLTEDSGPVSAS